MRTKLFKAVEADDDFGADGALDPTGYSPDDATDDNDNNVPGDNTGPQGDAPDAPDEGMAGDDLNAENTEGDNPDQLSNPDDPNNLDDSNQDEDQDDNFDPPPGPLNVDLVYRKNELKDNQKDNSKEYKNISKLIDKRNDDNGDNEPIALDIKVSKELDKDVTNVRNDDLEDDETASNPDDLDSEQDVRLEYEDMSIENYIDRFHYAVEIRYTNDANDELMRNMGNAAGAAGRAGMNAASTVGRAGINGAKAIGRGAANVGSHALSGSKVLGKGAAVVGGILAVAGIAATKKGILSIEKFWAKHESHFNSIEKKLAQLRKEVYLKDEIVKKSTYANSKVLTQILNHGVTNIHQQFSQQIDFRKGFSNVVLTALATQKTVTENLLRNANNKEFRDLTLKDFVIKNSLGNLFKPSKLEGADNPLLDILESKQPLMANKIILSKIPKDGLSSIEEYLDAMSQSKSSIYHLPESTEFKIDYLDKKHLLDLIDLCLRFTRDLKNDRDTFNKMIGIKKNVSSVMSKFNILSKLDMFAKADKETKHEIKSYLDTSTLYVDRVYVDAFINMTNVYYNSLKYTIYFIKAHLSAKD